MENKQLYHIISRQIHQSNKLENKSVSSRSLLKKLWISKINTEKSINRIYGRGTYDGWWDPLIDDYNEW